MLLKPLIEKLTPSDNTSFVARTYRTPHFEVPWHQHIENELILFTEGEGTAFIGNHIGPFKTGDVFLLGANLPHTFQKANPQLITSAVVVQFTSNFWGDQLFRLPEASAITELLNTAQKGLKMEGNLLVTLQTLVPSIETARGFHRIIQLLQSITVIAERKQFSELSSQPVKALNNKQRERIDKVFQYTITHFQDTISLHAIAAIADMSVPAFCSYFRKSTKKTYIDFLNEIRIGYACRQLIETRHTIEAIGYESGFNTLANFNKQFLKIKMMNPSQYRKKFSTANTAVQPVTDAVRSFE